MWRVQAQNAILGQRHLKLTVSFRKLNSQEELKRKKKGTLRISWIGSIGTTHKLYAISTRGRAEKLMNNTHLLKKTVAIHDTNKLESRYLDKLKWNLITIHYIIDSKTSAPSKLNKIWKWNLSRRNKNLRDMQISWKRLEKGRRIEAQPEQSSWMNTWPQS